MRGRDRVGRRSLVDDEQAGRRRCVHPSDVRPARLV